MGACCKRDCVFTQKTEYIYMYMCVCMIMEWQRDMAWRELVCVDGCVCGQTPQHQPFCSLFVSMYSDKLNLLVELAARTLICLAMSALSNIRTNEACLLSKQCTMVWTFVKQNSPCYGHKGEFNILARFCTRLHKGHFILLS